MMMEAIKGRRLLAPNRRLVTLGKDSGVPVGWRPPFLFSQADTGDKARAATSNSERRQINCTRPLQLYSSAIPVVAAEDLSWGQALPFD